MKSKNARPADAPTNAVSWLERAPILLLVGALGRGLLQILRYSRDLPYSDDWAALSGDALPAGFTLKWLFSFYNGHRIVFTKLQIWLLYLFDRWDLRAHVVSNYFIWILAAAALARLIRRGTAMRWGTIAAFLLFLFSTRMLVPFYGWISTCYLAIFFSLAAAQWLFAPEQKTTSLVLGTTAAWCASFSYGPGLVFCAAQIPVFCAFKLVRSAEPARDRRRELRQLACVLAALCAGIALCLTPWPSSPVQGQNFAWLTPAGGLYRELLSALIAQGFGWAGVAPVFLGPFCAALVLVPLAGTLWDNSGRVPDGAWPIYGSVLGLCAVLAAMILSRGGDIDWVLINISAHYCFFSCLLVPLCAAAWSLYLREAPALRRGALAALWLFCGVGYWSSGYWARIYMEGIATAQELQLNRLVDLMRGGDDADNGFPGDRQALEAARKLDVSFYPLLLKKLREQPESASTYDLDSAAPRDGWWAGRLRDSEVASLGRYRIGQGVYSSASLHSQGAFILTDIITLFRAERPRRSRRAFNVSVLPARSFPQVPIGARRARFVSVALDDLIVMEDYPASLVPHDASSEPKPSFFDLDRLSGDGRRSVPARGVSLTTFYRGKVLEAELMEVRRTAAWTEPAAKETLWVAYRGKAKVTLGGRTFVSKPGVILHIPDGVGRREVAPIGPEAYAALQIEPSVRPGSSFVP